MINCFKNVICALNLEWHCTESILTVEWLSHAWYRNPTIHLSDHWVLGHVSSQDLFCCSVWWDSQLREKSGCSKHIAFQNDGGLCVLGNTFRAAEVIHFPQVSASVWWHLWAAKQFFWPHGMDMHCQLIKRNGGPPQLKFTCHRNGCSVAKLWWSGYFLNQIYMLKLYNRNLPIIKLDGLTV